MPYVPHSRLGRNALRRALATAVAHATGSLPALPSSDDSDGGGGGGGRYVPVAGCPVWCKVTQRYIKERATPHKGEGRLGGGETSHSVGVGTGASQRRSRAVRFVTVPQSPPALSPTLLLCTSSFPFPALLRWAGGLAAATRLQ